MKIGIITFHWATNYGAVLQAYALQKYLRNLGFDTDIIDYIPHTCEKKLINCIITKDFRRIPTNILEYFKECQLHNFRKNHLVLSSRYTSYEALKNSPPPYDIYICGSDQIWNPYFTRSGEGNFTFSYFIDFGGINKRRIAYAASFGCTDYPKDLLKYIRPLLSRFNSISVREQGGKKIIASVSERGADLTPDPTLLLNANDYDKLIHSLSRQDKKFNFVYLLHSNDSYIRHLKECISNYSKMPIVDTNSIKYSCIGIENWLYLIKNSNLVVTNSYHGMIMSILFHKPFVAILVEGRLSGMNDRIFSLLNRVGLERRIIESINPSTIKNVFSESIVWSEVDQQIADFQKHGHNFLISNLTHNI